MQNLTLDITLDATFGGKTINFTLYVKDQQGKAGRKTVSFREWNGFEVPMLTVGSWINEILKREPFKLERKLFDAQSDRYSIRVIRKGTIDQMPEGYRQNVDKVFLGLQELKKKGEIILGRY